MTNPMTAIGGTASIGWPTEVGAITSGTPSGEGAAFQKLLLQSLDQVNSADHASQMAIEQSLIGGDMTQVEVLSAVKKADLALKMLVQIRNRVVDAYNEIKQMQL